MAIILLQFNGGLVESLGQVAVVAALLLLVLMVIALGTYAYKHLRGDGIEWPEDKQDDDGVSKSSDDEWKYS